MYYLMYIVRGYDEQRAVDLKESTWSLAGAHRLVGAELTAYKRVFS